MLAGLLVWDRTGSWLAMLLVLPPLSLAAWLAAAALLDQILRPLQTLTNVVAALRDEDFSFRARGARRGDSLGDLALEVNVLASSLQAQRTSAIDALSLVQLVLNSMQSPVLAFDGESRLHLLNPAAEHAFGLARQHALGRPAAEVGLLALLATPDEGLYQPRAGAPDQTSAGSGGSRPPSPAGGPQPERWSVRRTTFRLHGVPHSLFVLADVAAALREEERLAWQRLIRVLGHEINNSLAPIKSIAGSLRSRLPPVPGAQEAGVTRQHPAVPAQPQEMDRGLAVIEDRAESLNRFLQAYQRLSRLPSPALAPTPLIPLLSRVIEMEMRLKVRLDGGPELVLLADSDQLQQLFINLVRNAADSALAASRDEAPEVAISWTAAGDRAVLQILDNGTGLANSANLFVPFYTTKPGGTGIGLVLTQQIAAAHRGSVALRNREGAAGCEAEVRLPLWPASERGSTYAVS